MTLDSDQVAAALPQYEVGRELGRGAFGVVLAGRHRQLGREVAIKQLPRALAADPGVRSRFVAEARLLASLDHPHIVPVFDYVESDGLCLLVMEKLTGGTLWTRFTTLGLTPEAACAVVLAACSGLHAAHQRSILHRDMKPENVLFSSNDVVKIADFGIAKVFGGNETLATKAGEVLGTPAYMAPEQAQAGDLGPATDVYAAATMLYELLSGQLPYSDDGDALATLYRHVYEKPTPLLQVAPRTPALVANVVMTGLATKPEDRFTTAEAFGVALADATTAVWGPGWPAVRGNVTIMGSSAITAATERTTVPSGQVQEPPAAATPHDVQTVPAPETLPPVRAPETVQVRSVPAAPKEGELVPLREVQSRPKFPFRLATVGFLFLLAAVLTGVFGVGEPSHPGSLPPGAVQVNGQSLPSQGPVVVNLDEPVSVFLPPGTFDGRPNPETVKIELLLAGVRLGSATSALDQLPDGPRQASLDASGSRYLAGGTVTGRLEFVSADASAGSVSFPLRTTRQPFLTLPGVVVALAVLFLVAYAESMLGLLRRGRRRRTGVLTVTILGAILGSALALAAALLLGHEVSRTTLIAAGLAGAAAGFFIGRTAWFLGRYRRMARGQRSKPVGRSG